MSKARTLKAQTPAAGWLGKALAGLLLGLGLGCSALFIALTPEMAGAARAQLAMWLVPPVWLTVLGVSFLFRSGPRAWLVLGGLNLLVLLQAALVPR